MCYCRVLIYLKFSLFMCSYRSCAFPVGLLEVQAAEQADGAALLHRDVPSNSNM